MEINISDDLVLEVWPGGEKDRTLLKLRSRAMEQDGEGGAVVIYTGEIDGLVAALLEAQDILARPDFAAR